MNTAAKTSKTAASTETMLEQFLKELITDDTPGDAGQAVLELQKELEEDRKLKIKAALRSVAGPAEQAKASIRTARRNFESFKKTQEDKIEQYMNLARKIAEGDRHALDNCETLLRTIQLS